MNVDRLPELVDDPEAENTSYFDYRDWDPATSFVISGPLGPRGVGAGRRFTSPEADRWVRATYVVIRKINGHLTPGRWAYRVLRPSAPGGRYTPPKES